MQLKLLSSILFGLFILPFELFAEVQSFYCSEHHASINLGMTTDQVIAACGQPLSQQDSNQPLVQRIPVQQLIYNNVGGSTAFYGTWSISTGNKGSQLEIDLADQKVKAIRLNGSENNAVSVCKGNSIQAGDSAQKVYSACGNPSLINNTFIDEVIATTEKPKIWIYQPSQYQAAISLTFINGRLQSIH